MGKLFSGKDTKKEERAEASALKAGRISPKQYAKGEAKEGHGKGAMKTAAAIKSGKVSVAKYAARGK